VGLVRAAQCRLSRAFCAVTCLGDLARRHLIGKPRAISIYLIAQIGREPLDSERAPHVRRHAIRRHALSSEIQVCDFVLRIGDPLLRSEQIPLGGLLVTLVLRRLKWI